MGSEATSRLPRSHHLPQRTNRGDVINKQALVDALKRGKLADAGADVLAPDNIDMIMSFEHATPDIANTLDLIVTDFVAGQTDESMLGVGYSPHRWQTYVLRHLLAADHREGDHLAILRSEQTASDPVTLAKSGSSTSALLRRKPSLKTRSTPSFASFSSKLPYHSL